MRRGFAAVIVLTAGAALPAGAGADHTVPPATRSSPATVAMSGGQGARWEFLRSFSTGNLQSDLDFFSQGGETYMSAGTLAAGENGGQTLFKLTRDGGATVDPQFVASHPSASCVSSPGAALGLQHDVEASPKGVARLGDVLYISAATEAASPRSDAQVIIDATDAGGRCHDQGTLGLQNAPRGGLEIIDISGTGASGSGSVSQPKEIGLTSHVGQSHTVNVDPKRPHIAYSVTSDGVGVDDQGRRSNETSGFGLDGFEVVDIRSCLTQPLGTIPPGATLQQKRDSCRPQVYRFRYPSAAVGVGHTSKTGVTGCHELEIYADDRLTCGGGSAAIVFDMKGAFDDRGTPADFTDDLPRGAPLPCRVRASSSTPGFTTGARITDCVDGELNGRAQSLTVSAYPQGNDSLQGVRHIGSAHHTGSSAQPSTEDVSFDHEAELTGSGRFVLATDERGGGVSPPGASCTQASDNTMGNGGVHAYATERLRRSLEVGPPANREEADVTYARTPQGRKAIYRAPVRTGGEATECTAHVMQQVPGQNRIFMGWYSQGTQVIDFTENTDGTFEFREAAYFIPTNANEWTSHVFRAEQNPDGTFTYHGAAADFALADNGRNAVDFWKVTLPAPQPAGALAVPGAPPGSPPAGTPRRGRRFLISRRTQRQDRRGFIRVVVSCRQSSACRGTIRLSTARRFRSGRVRRSVALGRRSFTVRPRRRSVIHVRTSRAGRRLLLTRRTLRVRASAIVRPDVGAAGSRRLSRTGLFKVVRFSARRGR